MKIKYLLLVLTFSLILVSCDDFLNVTPKDRFIPVTTDHFEGMLNHTHLVSFSCHFLEYKTDDAYLPTWDGPGPPQLNMFWFVNMNGAGNSIRMMYRFEPRPFSESELDFLWGPTHTRLLYFNTVINSVLTSEGGTEARRRSLRAEALVQRSLEFFALVNTYAHHYNAATAATDLGIPMFMHADATILVPRSTVQQVYDRILADLYEALPYLPETPVLNRFRANYGGALALLSRVYLFMGDYNKALEYANRALSENSTLVDINDYIALKAPHPGVPAPPGFTAAPNNWVVLQDGVTPIPNAMDHPETILARNFLVPFGVWTNVAMSHDLMALFDHDNDKRIEQWYGIGWPPGANFLATHGVRVRLRGDQFSNGLNTPEMYLIRAESSARLGQLQNALDDVNKLRRHRFATGTHVDKTLADFNNDDFEVLRFVLEERRRELAFMGFRLWDLKRLNRDPRFATTITREIEGVTYTLLPNSNRYLRQLWPGSTVFNPHWELNPETD